MFNFKGFCGTGGSITSARDSPEILFTVAAMSPAVEEQVEALQYVLPVCAFAPSRSGFHRAAWTTRRVFILKGFYGTGGSITSARDSPGFLFTAPVMSPAEAALTLDLIYGELQVHVRLHVSPSCRGLCAAALKAYQAAR